ncbi:hypothetical protein AXF42_Ash021485 [Apostasia shenzhenica]|uniref:Uncharacterized protein n=1 Tax=Apostasia shenzhenica TaxID=1088818 RepID=A0A2H9ZQJ2_9ASPA|nr:hypothetical protein AXF42_Ash021485 [Apostasia shenzhenica]
MASINRFPLLLLSLPVLLLLLLLLLLLCHATMSTAKLPEPFSSLKNTNNLITPQVQNICTIGYELYYLLWRLGITWGLSVIHYAGPIDAGFLFIPSAAGPSLGYYVQFAGYRYPNYDGMYMVELSFIIPDIREMKIENVDWQSVRFHGIHKIHE